MNGPAVVARRVAEAERGRVAAVDHDHALEARRRHRAAATPGSSAIDVPAADDLHPPAVHDGLESLPGPFADVGAPGAAPDRPCRAASRIGAASGCLEYRSTLAASCRTCVESSRRSATTAIGQLRPPVGQRPRLVQDHRAAAIDLLEHGGVAHDDAALGGQRDGADDRHRDRDEQRAGRRHHEHGQEANGIAAPQPRGHGERHGNRRVDRRRADRPGGEASGRRCSDSRITRMIRA